MCSIKCNHNQQSVTYVSINIAVNIPYTKLQTRPAANLKGNLYKILTALMQTTAQYYVPAEFVLSLQLRDNYLHYLGPLMVHGHNEGISSTL